MIDEIRRKINPTPFFIPWTWGSLDSNLYCQPTRSLDFETPLISNPRMKLLGSKIMLLNIRWETWKKKKKYLNIIGYHESGLDLNY